MTDSFSRDLRQHFPLFAAADRTEKPWHYLDSAASSQKPFSVIASMSQYYETSHANVHRGVYRLAEKATLAFEEVREKTAKFLGAASPREIIFTPGNTAGLNLVAHSYGNRLQPGDEVVLTIAEHHSNFVPWQMLAKRRGLTLKHIPLRPDLSLDLEKARELIGPRCRILTFGHVSNVLGQINPVAELCQLARAVGAVSVVDGAQGVPHLEIDVQKLGCDFYSFSPHKALGPTGFGVLFGREKLLSQMDPFLGGGEMIQRVDLHESTWADLPHRFEAGTPPIAEVIGWGAAMDFYRGVDRKAALAHERELGREILAGLSKDSEITVFMPPQENWIGIVTFTHARIHPHDIAALQDSFGVCVRAGHHCAQPLMRYLGVEATTRVSPYLYNTTADVAQFLKAMEKARTIFA